MEWIQIAGFTENTTVYFFGGKIYRHFEFSGNFTTILNLLGKSQSFCIFGGKFYHQFRFGGKIHRHLEFWPSKNLAGKQFSHLTRRFCGVGDDCHHQSHRHSAACCAPLTSGGHYHCQNLSACGYRQRCQI